MEASQEIEVQRRVVLPSQSVLTLQQLLNQIDHAFFQLIDTPEQPSLQLG
jgi:hypothetical protein